VALYDGTNFLGKGIVFDSQDSNLENWNNLSQIESFGDKTSSLVYRLPPGFSAELYEDADFGGRVIKLSGSGRVANITSRTWSNGETDVNDKISSLRVLPDNSRTLFVSDERTSETAVFTDFLTPYLQIPASPGSILKINGTRTIALGTTNVLSRPMQIRAFGGSVVIEK
jgi:hypothetical protein